MTPEEALDQDERWALVGHVAHGVLHDLNNFLSTITTLSELLLMDAESDSGPAQDLEEIKQAAWDAAATVKNLQVLAGGLGRRAPASAVSTDVAAAVRGLEFFLRRLVPSAASLEIEASPSATVPVDQGALQEALLALAVEARGTVGAGDVVRVDVRVEPTRGTPDGADVSVGVSAKGIGSDAGIGTRTAARFAKQAGGRLDVERQPDGTGSVRILLPNAV